MSDQNGFTLEQLSDIEAIRQLKADYWWLVDTRDWKAWRELFTDDMKFFMGGKELLSGGDAMVASVKQSLEGCVSAHQGHQSKVEITGPDTAKGRWILNDYLKWSDGRFMRGYGYYIEDYKKGKDGKWRIKTLTLGYFHQDQ
jgi:ketosteroid isomerase-like protein